MKIHNIRLGFATNSSSSHSIIFDPSLKNVNDDYNDDNFGWEYFTLASKEAKDHYLASMLISNLVREDGFSKQLIGCVLKGLNIEPLPDFYDKESYGWEYPIDHQSEFILPKDIETGAVSLDFFKDFRNYLLRDGVYILGGNDNDGEPHPLFTKENELNLNGYVPESGPLYCRKDGQWWTLFNKASGNRIVLSFEENPAPFKPETPMLIDFKITDFCDKNCKFCYQGSTKEGKHMDHEIMYRITSHIGKARVFEVAIGGGEPTSHPDFIQILKELNRNNVTVNFTTKSMEWLENEKQLKEIIPLIGSFAFSVDTHFRIDRIVTILKYHNIGIENFTVQVIPATCSKYSFEYILKTCSQLGVRVTLLGFKETGRGKEFKQQSKRYNSFNEEDWLGVVNKLHQEGSCPSLAIDTTLAARYVDQLKAIGIPDWLYHVQEGRYSAYIDGVEMKFGPSSYHPDKLIPYEYTRGSLNPIADMFNMIEEV